MEKLHPDEVIERLRSFPWDRYDVEYAILFGSVAERRDEYEDIDIAVMFREYTFDKYADLLIDIAEHLGIPERYVEVVVLDNREDIPCALVVEVFSGILLYARNHETYIRDLLSWRNVCIDFLIDRRKLNTVETAISAVLRQWE